MSEENDQPAPPGEHIVRSEIRQEGTAWRLLGAGADVNAKNKFDETPFFIALKYHNWPVDRVLRRWGAEASQFSPDVFSPAAAAGDAAAMASLGYCNELCGMKDFPRAYARALEWYRRAATAGDAFAMYRIGLFYDKGRVVPQDYGKAMEWYSRSAAAGSTEAMVCIGVFHANGDGVPKDFAKAVEWYLKAAAAGDAFAMWNLGVFYEGGICIPQDYAKALEWCSRAAALGKPYAMRTVGSLYVNVR